MNYLENLHGDIILLQDTHLINNKVSAFNDLWKGKAYHSCYTNNSRGTSILIKNRVQHNVLKEFISAQGNYVIVQCRIDTETYVLGSIYGPNKDEPRFYEQIDEILENVDFDHIVLGGDFNFVMNANDDCYGYVRENNVNARNTFISVCNKHNIIDVWRHQNPRTHQYTWHTAKYDKGSRLDMFFVSKHLSSRCTELHIKPGYRTDHSIITMMLRNGESQRGPGLWKFNESLLKDDNYIKVVNDCVNRTIQEYALPIYAHEFLSHESNYEHIEFNINDGLFYETLLMMIRGETVKYAKQKAKRRREQEKELMSQIELANTEFAHTKSEEVAVRINSYNEQLERIRKPLIDGLIVRSRTKWHEDGEKSSKFFLGLEKNNAMRKTVTSLKIGDKTFTRTSSILTKFSENLSKKYNKDHTLSSMAKKLIDDNICTTLSAAESDILEQPITFKELTEALQRMRKGKSPGSNGYTACFFKYFWRKLGPFLYRAFLFCLNNGKTLLSHREGTITMIPKAGRNPDNIQGWRPITLLNVDFKIISAAVSRRLHSVTDKLIDKSQTAYIKGRFIGENTRIVYDVINYLIQEKRQGLIMSADFEAAFDSISWKFVSQVLDRYGFGPDFRKTINTLYLNTENFSRILLHGHLGEKIHFKCGIRQGDPASGYLFNLAVNILAQQIKRSNILTGIKIFKSEEIRISQYADDTVLFLENSTECLKGALQELNCFSEASGLRLNIEKTSCMQIGTTNPQHSVNNLGIKWVSHMKILGIIFTNDNNNITKCNLKPKIEQIQKAMAQWRRRNLTPLGRITVIKSLLISKLVHLLTALPDPSEEELKNLERLLFEFVWAGKRDPVKRAKVIQGYSHGGLNMLDVRAFTKSMKLSWLKRLFAANTTWQKVINYELPDIQDILTYGSKQILKVSARTKNQFWKNVLEAFASFSSAFKPGMPQILSEAVWYSDYTKFKCSVVNSWNKKGIRFIADLVNEDSGQLHTKSSLENSFGIKMTFLCFSSLMRSLPDEVKCAVIDKKCGPIIPARMNLVMNHVNFPRFAYNTYIENKLTDVTRTDAKLQEKWRRDLACFEDGSFGKVIKATKSTHSRMFQYKLMNRFLATNKYLKTIKIKDDDKCTFCKLEVETLAHMFWYCPKVQLFIAEIKIGLINEFSINIGINEKTWFFLTDLRMMEVCIITIAKRVIYESRLNEVQPSFTHFRNKLKLEIEIEFQAARQKNKQKKFDKKWGTMGGTPTQ